MKDYNYYEEELACVHQYLDTLEVPRSDGANNYSTVGRIKQLEKIFYKRMSSVEDYYLNSAGK